MPDKKRSISLSKPLYTQLSTCTAALARAKERLVAANKTAENEMKEAGADEVEVVRVTTEKAHVEQAMLTQEDSSCGLDALSKSFRNVICGFQNSAAIDEGRIAQARAEMEHLLGKLTQLSMSVQQSQLAKQSCKLYPRSNVQNVSILQ